MKAATGEDVSAEDLGGAVRLMFPMITTYEELHKVRRYVAAAKKQLEKDNKTFADASLGMMLEVPAAAITIDSMLEAVDFVSIGSNDLIQYLMAADRDNPKVNHLCQPLAPPVQPFFRTTSTAYRPTRKCE